MKILPAIVFLTGWTQLSVANDVSAYCKILKIDGRTASSTKSSIASMEKCLVEDERRKFRQAILTVRMTNSYTGYDSPYKGPSIFDDELLGKRIDGMTYEQIMAITVFITPPIDVP